MRGGNQLDTDTDTEVRPRWVTTEANQSGTRGHKITTSHRLSSRARVFTRVAAPRLTPDGSIVPVTGPLLHY